jgi:uncharacterized protein YjiS (DUF1127 family)
MSNRLYATDRIDIVRGVEVPEYFDQTRIIQQADVLRGEALARMVGTLWRAVCAAGQRLFRSPAGVRDAAELAELDDHTLADIGITRYQVPHFVTREFAAARDIASRTRHLREPAQAV